MADESDNAQVIDLAAARSRRLQAAAPVAVDESDGDDDVTLVEPRPGQVELSLLEFTYTFTARAAADLATALQLAARAAERLTKPQCPRCAKHACRDPHPGQIRQSNNGRLPAVVERICARSVRMREVSREGRVFYVGFHTLWYWDVVGWTGPS